MLHDVIDHLFRTAGDDEVHQMIHMNQLHDAVAAGVLKKSPYGGSCSRNSYTKLLNINDFMGADG